MVHEKKSFKGFHDVSHFDLLIHQTGNIFANLKKVDIGMHQTKFGENLSSGHFKVFMMSAILTYLFIRQEIVSQT